MERRSELAARQSHVAIRSARALAAHAAPPRRQGAGRARRFSRADRLRTRRVHDARHGSPAGLHGGCEDQLPDRLGLANLEPHDGCDLGIVDNVSVLAVRDGDLKPLPFGETLESDTKLWAPEF